MTTSPQLQLQEAADRFGRSVAARLTAATAELPYDISERLRAARVQALGQRKRANVFAPAAFSNSGGTATLGFGEEGPGWGNRIASALSLLALVGGLILISTVQDEIRANEVAEVDAALLTDDLPPAAYADPGFIQFLKVHRDSAR